MPSPFGFRRRFAQSWDHQGEPTSLLWQAERLAAALAAQDYPDVAVDMTPRDDGSVVALIGTPERAPGVRDLDLSLEPAETGGWALVDLTEPLGEPLILASSVTLVVDRALATLADNPEAAADGVPD